MSLYTKIAVITGGIVTSSNLYFSIKRDGGNFTPVDAYSGAAYGIFWPIMGMKVISDLYNKPIYKKLNRNICGVNSVNINGLFPVLVGSGDITDEYAEFPSGGFNQRLWGF